MRKWLGNLCHMVTAPPKLDPFAVNTRTRSFMGPWVPHFNPDVFWIFLMLGPRAWLFLEIRATESHRKPPENGCRWQMVHEFQGVEPPAPRTTRIQASFLCSGRPGGSAAQKKGFEPKANTMWLPQNGWYCREMVGSWLVEPLESLAENP